MKKQMNKPDLAAPRFRPTRYNLLSEKFFNRFKKKFPQYKDHSNKELREIIGTYNGLLWKTAVETRDGAEMPEGLGYIFIGSCPSPRKFNVDYSVSLDTGTRLRHRNFESDNFLAKIFYTNYANKYKFQHRELWQFKGVRKFTRTVAEVYPENWMNYLQVDNLAHISKMFKKSIKTELIMKRNDIIPESYNEFDMK